MKKIFLKFLSLFLALILCNVAVACDNGNENSSSDMTNDYSEILKDYVASECLVETSNENLSKVIVEPTFDTEKYTNTAEGVLIPYYIFTDGMCLQRDNVLKIFGSAPSITRYIAVKFRGSTYYGSIESGNWEVYLPKMTAGGPFEMEIVSNVGRVSIHNVYVGEVFLLSGQSNMEFNSYWNSSQISDLYADAAA